jgi:hypothetical protein
MMLRKLLTTAVVVACACASLAVLAAERATYILSDGSRKSGQLVSHGDEHQSFILGVLSLGNDNGGPEFNYPIDQVGVIDLAGGQPAATELSQLPASGQMVAMRDGRVVRGTFVNIINGETLIWRDQQGNSDQMPLNSVARIYLNPQVARTAYNYTGPSSTTAAVATAGQGGTPAGAVLVKGNQAWNDTGITVKKGDRLTFSATGQITYGPNADMTAGPDGNASLHMPQYPVPALPVGALIGRIGLTGSSVFGIGANTQPIEMPAGGRLLLGVNDNQTADNTGAFTVTVGKVQ